MIVRRAAAVDADGLAHVWAASAAAAYAGIVPQDDGDLERRRRRWLQVLEAGSTRPYVAEEGNDVIGFANVGSAESEHGLGELYSLYVHPDWWGTGAGQALLERAEADLAAQHPEAVLTVLAANPRARRFYERNGWRLAAQLVEPHFGGIRVEVCRYRKRFAPGHG